MLQLPVTIRLPLPGEMPHRSDIEELLQKRKKANIVEGFCVRPNTTRQLPFSFYAEINVNNSQLWDLFIHLSELFPQEICCMYGVYGNEAVTTAYFSKEEMLKTLSRFELELTQDCTLEYGLLSNNTDELVEIFITESKYIRFWGSNKQAFLQCMHDFKIREIADLAFVDDYPKIVEPLRKFIPSAKRPEDVVYTLDRVFNIERGNFT